jgi:hypothetical protein
MLVGQLWFPSLVKAVVFSDIDKHWARTDIEQMVSHGLLAGYPDGQFRPQQDISRAELTVLLARLGTDNDSSGNNPSIASYFDVKATDWFYPGVMQLTQAGIVHGTGAGFFKPHQPVKRQEAAQMLWFYLQTQGWTPDEIPYETILADEKDISDWARTAVKILLGQQLLAGYPDGSFKPGYALTRAEACTILNQVHNRTIPVVQIAEPESPTIPQTHGSLRGGGSHTPPEAPAPAPAASNSIQCQIRVIN